MSQSKTYEDEGYCGNCKEYTHQTIHDDGHERDSSGDWRYCHKCQFRYSGMTGKWTYYGELNYDTE
jgi:hypothetical protein